MDRTDIESGKGDDLLIGHAHGVAREDEDPIEPENEDEDVLAEEAEEDAGDLDFEPEAGGDS